MDLKQLSKPLPIESIDFRIQSINKGGYATILAYKDARVDMQRLDEVCTPLNWKREHSRDNKNCTVSIWSKELEQWVSKEDTGTESNTEQAKGLASDSFKRACFNWGIGRELYDYPQISIKLKSNEWKQEGGKQKPTWDLKMKEWIWHSEFEGNVMIRLSCVDGNGKDRFNWNIDKQDKKEFVISESQISFISTMLETSTLSDNKIHAIMERVNDFTETETQDCIYFLQNNQKESQLGSQKEINKVLDSKGI